MGQESEPNGSFLSEEEIRKLEFPEEESPRHLAAIEKVRSILGQSEDPKSIETSKTVVEDPDSEIPYTPEIETECEPYARHLHVLKFVEAELDTKFKTLLAQLSIQRNNRKEFLEYCKTEEEEIIEVERVKPQQEFIYISKFPRSDNEEKHIRKKVVLGNQGRKRRKKGIMTTSKRVFPFGTLVLVTRE